MDESDYQSTESEALTAVEIAKLDAEMAEAGANILAEYNEAEAKADVFDGSDENLYNLTSEQLRLYHGVDLSEWYDY